MAESVEILVLTDGRAGNEQQALALAEAVGRTRPIALAVRRIRLKRWAVPIPPALSHGLRHVLPGWPFGGIADGLEPADIDRQVGLIIGAGRRVAPIVAALRQRLAATAVQLLNPQMANGAFDAIVVPDHDRISGPNVLMTRGAMSRMTPAHVAEAASAWTDTFAALPRPCVAVLVGGPSRSARFTQQDQQRLVEALDGLATTHGLMITTSRRTPDSMIGALRARLGNRAFLWTGDGANPYPGLLGHADAVLVTADSVNMASEAATTGLPVHVFAVTGLAPKLARFQASLEEHGASRPFGGEIGSWQYPPLAEADRIVAELRRRSLV